MKVSTVILLCLAVPLVAAQAPEADAEADVGFLDSALAWFKDQFDTDPREQWEAARQTLSDAIDQTSSKLNDLINEYDISTIAEDEAEARRQAMADIQTAFDSLAESWQRGIAEISERLNMNLNMDSEPEAEPEREHMGPRGPTSVPEAEQEAESKGFWSNWF